MATLTDLVFELVDCKPANPVILSEEKEFSIARKLSEHFENAYILTCGNPIIGRLYLICDERFNPIPDLLFEGVSKEKNRLYGYLIPEEKG